MDNKIIVEKNEIKHVNYESLLRKLDDENMTLFDILERRMNHNPKDDCFGTIVKEKVEYEKNEAVFSKILNLSGFLEKILPEKEPLGIFSINCPEWVIAEYAGYMINSPNVPLYATFHKDSLKTILQETNIKVIVCSPGKSKFLLKNVLDESNYGIEAVIFIEDSAEWNDDSIIKGFQEKGIKLYYFNQIVLDNNNKLLKRQRTPKPFDIASICYTSGTTGEPKGVILTHRNFVAQVTALKMPASEDDIIKISQKDTFLSYLPLAHVFERVSFTFMIDNSARIAFYRGNPKMLQKDLELVKPTLLNAVPRVLNVFKTKIDEKIAGSNSFIRWIFRKALAYKKRRLREGSLKSFLVDKIIFDKISKRFGGCLRYILVGGASLNPETKDFLQCVLSCNICMGYGQTECLAAATIQPMWSFDSYTIGIPFVSTKLKIERMEDYSLNYNSSGGIVGHLLLKGPGVTQGYYKRLEQTEELFADNGWIKSGDIVKFENSMLYIVGRQKEIFKTSYGEYIVPENLESLFSGGDIEDVFITGTRYSDAIIAVVSSPKTEMSQMDVELEFQVRATQLLSEQKINKYEIPSSVILFKKSFTDIQDGKLFTPSFKKKRNLFFEYFKNEILKYLE